VFSKGGPLNPHQVSTWVFSKLLFEKIRFLDVTCFGVSHGSLYVAFSGVSSIFCCEQIRFMGNLLYHCVLLFSYCTFSEPMTPEVTNAHVKFYVRNKSLDILFLVIRFHNGRPFSTWN